MIRKAFAVLCLCACAGCYTQFAMIDRNDAGIAPPDSTVAGDSGQSRIQDTLRVSNNQVCYWTRDMWGRPELRCDDSYYGRDWYRYNNYPWWSRSDPYYYGSYNSYGWDEQCPAYYYYDYSCGACRYYRGYQGSSHSWWWDSPDRYGSSPGSGSASPTRPRRSPSSAVPGTGTSSGTLRKAPGTYVGSGPTSGVTENGGSSSGTVRERRSTSDAVPSASEARRPAATESSVVRELPKQQVQEQPQSVPQPPPESASPRSTDQGNQSNQSQKPDDKQRDRRNPRSW
jgi:hypothetical protein